MSSIYRRHGQGFEMSDQIEAVLERFVVVWPENVADT